MHAENLLVNQGRNGHDIEDVNKIFPNFKVVFAFACIRDITTLVVEAVYSIDAGTLVVSPQKEEIFRKLDFVAKE